MNSIVITFIIYFFIIFIVCYYANRRTKGLSDYILGHRSLSGPITALGAGASDMSGWLLLALPGTIFLHGLNQIWLPIGLSIGAYFNWRLVSPRLRVYTEVAGDALTIPAYFDHRFHEHTKIIRVVTALAVVVFFTFYSAAGFVSGALLFQTAFHLSYTVALWSSAAFIILYTVFGGFLGISWIDFFQGSLMFFALILTPLYTFHYIGGWHVMLHRLMPLGHGYLQPFHDIGVIGILSLLTWGLGYFGQPHILVRFMVIRSVRALPAARRICMTWMVISLLGAIATGIVGHAFFTGGLLDPESTFLKLAEDLFIPWLAGILLAAVLSAIMSTNSAQLLAGASALVEDFYHRFLRKQASQKELVVVSRLMVGVIALVAIGLATDPKGTILQLVSYAWAGLGAAFGPVVLGSLFWKRMTGKGAIAGIVTGMLVVILWKAYLLPYGGVLSVYELLPGFLLASLAILGVSLLDKPPAQVVRDEFETVKERLHD